MNNTRIAAFEKLMDTMNTKGIVHEDGRVTVSELIAKLQYMEDVGMGDYAVWYRPYNAPDYRIAEGVWDYDEESKTITLA